MRVRKLKEEKTCEEYRHMVRDKVEEATWKGLDVNEHWQQMKGIMVETAQDICGMTKGPCRHTARDKNTQRCISLPENSWHMLVVHQTTCMCLTSLTGIQLNMTSSTVRYN